MLKAGIARRDITPPAGSRMACFPRGPNREARRARGAHDPLQAAALVLSDGDQAVAIVCCDLCGIRRLDLERIRARVTEQLPALAGGRVVVACSHSHSSVESLYLFGNTPDDPFMQDMDRRIADAVCAAHAGLAPVTLGVAAAPVALNHNRRVLDAHGRAGMAHEYDGAVTGGPADPELVVLTIRSLGGHVDGVAFRYTAHALALGPGNDLYTADYPGRAPREIEEAFPGCTALYMNGAAGNVHPRECMRSDFSAMERMGRALGQAAVELTDSAGSWRR